MSGKQMEGDNQRRRTLARQAREHGRRPSQTGATLGSSKQFEHVSRVRREGPPPAGARKPTPRHGAPKPPPAAPPAAARMDPEIAELQTGLSFTPVRYRELVSDIGQRAGIDFDQASRAAEATVIALARALDEAGRQRLLEAVPPALRNDYPTATPHRPRGLIDFLDDVARMTLRSREQARYQAQATLNALAEQGGDLVESLDIPSDIRELLQAPRPGGGLVTGTGGTGRLTDEEIRAALVGLPYWSGSTQALIRTLTLPSANLDRTVGRLRRLRQEIGRAPHISRQDNETAVIVVRTDSVQAVTAADVDLAHAVDAAIDESAAGIA